MARLGKLLHDEITRVAQAAVRTELKAVRAELRAARKELGLTTDQTIMIGDTMETDILGGVQLGFHTVLVLSGGTRADDLPRYAYRPETVVPSLAELADLFDAHDWTPPWRARGRVLARA